MPRSAAKWTIAAWRSARSGTSPRMSSNRMARSSGFSWRQLGELGGEPVLPAALGMEVELERAEADAEADACGAAEVAEAGQLRQLGLGIGLLPAAAQMGVGLGRVEIETIAVGGEEAHRRGALRPAPGPAEKALDDAELGSRAAPAR